MVTMYGTAKTFHRYGVLVTAVLVLFLAVTGILLKYSDIANTFSIPLGLVRHLHNQVSTFGGIALFFMTVSGVVMYVVPMLKRRV